MRFVIASLPQMFVMAAIVNTALFLPFGAIVAVLSFVVFGISLQGFITLGGEVNAFEGLVAWWIVFLVPSLAYAAYAMPWTPPTGATLEECD